MTAHSITILSELKMSPFGPYAGAKTHSINCTINCTLLKAVSNVQQFLNFVDSCLVHALLDKAVNKQAK